MYVKIRNWTGDDLRKKHLHLFELLQEFTGNRVREIYVKAFEYYDCWIINTKDMVREEAFAKVVSTVCWLAECDVTIKYRQWADDLRDQNEYEFLGCRPTLEIWLNDGSQYSYEVPDYEEDGWFD